MIISEQQIMELMSVAQVFLRELIVKKCDPEGATQIANLVNQINWQQSTELKEIK